MMESALRFLGVYQVLLELQRLVIVLTQFSAMDKSVALVCPAPEPINHRAAMLLS
jgi:hypothetical protein